MLQLSRMTPITSLPHVPPGTGARHSPVRAPRWASPSDDAHASASPSDVNVIQVSREARPQQPMRPTQWHPRSRSGYQILRLSKEAATSPRRQAELTRVEGVYKALSVAYDPPTGDAPSGDSSADDCG